MIPLFKVFMSDDVIKPINDVLMSGQLTQGKQVEKFEEELKKLYWKSLHINFKFCYCRTNISTKIIEKRGGIA